MLWFQMISSALRRAALGGSAIVCVVTSASCRPKNPEKLAPAPKVVASVASSNVADAPSPLHELRQLWPQSGSVVLSTQVGFRWLGAASHVELSRTRSFDKGFERLDGSAVSSDPQLLVATSADLSDGVWFWRVSGPARHSDIVWSFRVHSVQDAQGNLLDGADINCDGRADILLKGQVILGGGPPTRLRCGLGPAAVNELKPVSDQEVPDWGQLVSIGDVDGDGCGDAVTTATPILHQDQRSQVPVPILFRGQAGLSSTWLAARRLNRDLSPIGDLNHDGYADTVECTVRECTVYLGGRDGVQERPFLVFNNDWLPLGGDFDADGLPDLWAVNHATAGHGYMEFFSGKSSFSPVPTSSLTLPGDLNGTPAAGLIVGGRSTVVGFATKGRSDLFWRATASPPSITGQAWPGAAHASAGWTGLWRVGVWEFVPLTGPGARGVLVILPVQPDSPAHSFLQYGFTAAGAPFFLGRLTTPGLGPQDGLDWFARIGDTNGDGYDDLLVHGTEDTLGAQLSFEYRGSATGFTYKQQW
ncbi:MAG: hypothetical protein ABJB12_02335 [Pseudomonadota bacterium]